MVIDPTPNLVYHYASIGLSVDAFRPTSPLPLPSQALIERGTDRRVVGALGSPTGGCRFPTGLRWAAGAGFRDPFGAEVYRTNLARTVKPTGTWLGCLAHANELP